MSDKTAFNIEAEARKLCDQVLNDHREGALMPLSPFVAFGRAAYVAGMREAIDAAAKRLGARRAEERQELKDSGTDKFPNSYGAGYAWGAMDICEEEAETIRALAPGKETT